MIDDKRLKEVEQNIPRYLKERLITKKEEHKKLLDFYINTAKMSLKVAEILFNISSNNESKEKLSIEEEFECYLWVTVCSYYAMFYVANAALAKKGLKIGEKIVHKITSDCLIFYFIKTGKLAKHYYEEYEESMNNAMEVMGVDEEKIRKQFQQKAIDLIATFDFEKKKRGDFQYNTTVTIKESAAKTSLERAKDFLYEMEKAVEKARS